MMNGPSKGKYLGALDGILYFKGVCHAPTQRKSDNFLQK